METADPVTESTLITLVSTIPVSNTTGSSLIGNSTLTIPDYTLALSGISACLSIIGALAIFISFAKLPEIRNFTRRLLTYLTVADLLTAIGYFVGMVRYAAIERDTFTPPPRDSLCCVQSFSIIFSNLSSYLWTIVIALHIFVSYMCQTNVTSRGGMHIIYHIICWGVPAAVAITAAAADVLGEDNSVAPTPWCFLRGGMEHEKLVYWHFGVVIAWELITYLSTSFLYLCLKFKMFLRSRSLRIQLEVTTGLRPEDRNYVCVWLVLYLLKIWGTVRVFIVIDRPDIAYTNGEILFTLLNIQCLFTSAQAFANCILFCFCDGVVRRHFCRGCRDREEGRPLLANA